MLQDILQAQTALFDTGVQTVLRGQETRVRRVSLQKGVLVNNQRSETRGLCAKVLKNGVAGFSAVAEYDVESARRVLRAATENAKFLDAHAPRGLSVRPLPQQGAVLCPMQIHDTHQQRLIDACRQIDDHIAKTYPDLTSRSVVYYEDSMDKIIYSSDGCHGHMCSPRCYIYVILNAEARDGAPLELFKAFGGAGSFEDQFSDVTRCYPEIQTLYEHLMAKKEGVYAEAGTRTVILGGMMAGMLAHEAVGHTVEADLVQGGSVAGPLLNKRVGSELVNLVDFAHTAFGKPAPLPVWLDDEGTLANDAVLIENGILKGYMHDRLSAQRYGVAPTGNARAWAFNDEPLIRMRNTAVLPGKDKLEDMIASVDDGYYLIDSGNGQADLTGEFMFGVTMGYEIKKGKLGRAILGTTVSGVAFEMLKSVDMVSDTVTWSSSGFCGKKQPMAVGMGGPQLRCRLNIGGR